jgi:hypothetical protein
VSPKGDKLAIIIEGSVRPTLLGRDFRLIICKNENGGYYIRDFPKGIIRHITIEGVTDFKETWRETSDKERPII